MAVVQIPVLEDMNGYVQISMYVSTADGGFKRSPKRPFRGMRNLIAGVSSPMGTIETNPRVRVTWRTPTVILYSQRYPQSVYDFFREKIAAKKYYIATAGHRSIRCRTLSIHKVAFKPGVSIGIKRLFGNKCVDSMRLWGVSTKLAK